MSAGRGPASSAPAVARFEWWMLSNFAVGAAFSGFVSLLIPPFVSEVTGDASAAGVVMAVISLAAVLGPVLGGFADRYRAHRWVVTLGVAGMVLAFWFYSVSADQYELFFLDAILMGVAIAAVSAVGPAFIIGGGLDKADEARQMTTFQLMMPAGQVVAGAALALAGRAGWSYADRFTMGAVLVGACVLPTWLGSAAPLSRMIAARGTTAATPHTPSPTPSLRSVLLSMFGVYLLVLTLSSAANNGINNQISNMLPNLYGIDEATTSAIIAAAGLLNIVLFFPAGAWMARGGPIEPFMAGTAARLVAAVGLAAAGLMAQAPVLLVVALVQLLYQSNPFVRLTQAPNAVRFATFPAAVASGWVIAAAALGSFAGSVIGGLLADAYGFNAINVMAAVAAGAATLLTVTTLRPAAHRARSEPSVLDGQETNPAAS